MTSRRLSPGTKPNAGSPSPGEPVFLAVGRFRRPHGVRGEILMEVMTDFPERLKPGVTFFLGEEHRPIQLAAIRQHNKGLLVSLDGYQNREEVGVLRNQILFVRADDRPPLPEGEYYHHQLLGLQVVTEEGEALGVLAEIMETSANEIFVVRPESGKDILIPDIEEVVLEIDLESRKIVVRLLPGLLPE